MIPLRNSKTGFENFRSIPINAIPKMIDINTTWSILLLLDAAAKILLGTISTNGCNGPLFSWTESAKFCLLVAWSPYSFLKVSW